MHKTLTAVFVALALTLLAAAPAAAGEVTETFDFELDAWKEIDAVDGPVTLHRIRLDRKQDRVTKSVLSRPYNQEYLDVVRVTLEFTNEATSTWKARLDIRWLDAEGRVIDGFGANEKLDKKAAREVVRVSIPTLKYAVERAKTLEVKVHFRP